MRLSIEDVEFIIKALKEVKDLNKERSADYKSKFNIVMRKLGSNERMN